MLKKLLLGLGLFLSLQQTADAKVISEVQSFLMTELTKLNGVAVAGADLVADDQYESAASGYYFSAFWLRIRAEVGFDVEFGKLALVPEIELTWM